MVHRVECCSWLLIQCWWSASEVRASSEPCRCCTRCASPASTCSSRSAFELYASHQLVAEPAVERHADPLCPVDPRLMTLYRPYIGFGYAAWAYLLISPLRIVCRCTRALARSVTSGRRAQGCCPRGHRSMRRRRTAAPPFREPRRKTAPGPYRGAIQVSVGGERTPAGLLPAVQAARSAADAVWP